MTRLTPELRNRREIPPRTPGTVGPALGAALLLALGACRPTPRASGPLPQDAYVWQRDWSSNVVQAVRDRGPAFSRVVVLAGELDLRPSPPRWTPVPFAPPPPRADTKPLTWGLALRVGPFPGPFEPEGNPIRLLRRLARESLARAQRAGVPIAEVQIDFDCADRHLDGYRVWIEALKRELAPMPVTITALPSWLDQRSFRTLAAVTDGFVLQVHSLARPRHARDPLPLCDPVAARLAVERAARIAGEVPFRVALPTYGYRLAYGPDGTFLGASAEGPLPEYRTGTVLRDLEADPAAMASLVARWTTDRPTTMQGLIWYRLPVTGDQSNWRWPTLVEVMAGKTPKARLATSIQATTPGLAEITLINSGTADFSGPVAVRARWSEARRVGADGIRGFDAFYASSNEVLFTQAICRLPAGEESRIGWVRLDASVPITLEVAESAPPIPEPPDPP